MRAEIESFFADAPPAKLESTIDVDKGHGRIEQRTITVSREVDWLTGERRFPGELRLPAIATVIRISSRAELKDHGRFETRYYISSAELSAERAAAAIRGHWAIENTLHWCLDVSFAEDQCRARTGYAAENLAILRHISLNILKQETTKKRGIKGKQKNAGWNHLYLLKLLAI